MFLFKGSFRECNGVEKVSLELEQGFFSSLLIMVIRDTDWYLAVGWDIWEFNNDNKFLDSTEINLIIFGLCRNNSLVF